MTENNGFTENTGDMPVKDFRTYGYKLIDWIADYIENIESLPVSPDLSPGEIKKKFNVHPPEYPTGMEEIFKSLDENILPGMTHWNHPGFMAYFNSTASGPGILAELLSGAFNINGMLWKSCPSATELEEITLGWLREMVGLPNNFWGIIYDGASSSSMHALAAAKEAIKEFPFRVKGMSGIKGFPRLRLYTSEHAHSSIEKGAVTIGIGLEGVKKIPVDSEFRMKPGDLQEQIIRDKQDGWLPFCVVATIGTTSSTSIDPVTEIADICSREKLWLHVDAAHAGIAAIVPEKQHILNGCEKADSIVINPHKWLFMPIDISAFYTKKPDVLRRAFSIEAEYLKTDYDKDVTNYMDYGVQLGRRFRSLKLLFVLMYFGKSGLISRIKEHLRIAETVTKWIDNHPDFERMAPVPLSTICFRANPGSSSSDIYLNNLNEKLLRKLNQTGKAFLTHTKLNEKFVMRIVVSGIRTEERHALQTLELLEQHLYNILEEEK